MLDPCRDGRTLRVMFLYWGRRGAVSRWSLEIANAAREMELPFTLSLSRQNEQFEDFKHLSDELFLIDTFSSNLGAVFQSARLPFVRRQLLDQLIRKRIDVVVAMMPHIWTPLIAPAVRRAGIRYVTTIHNAVPHPGDPTGLVHDWELRDIQHADMVITLSSGVAAGLHGRVAPDKVLTLFTPDLRFSEPEAPTSVGNNEPLRLLFIGRILPYKNLPLFLDAVDLLIQRGVRVEVGVFGPGPLGNSSRRLSLMGAQIVNRWINDGEVASILSRFHAVVLSHIEASQSAVIATALGAGIPVVATPVGGLVEQLEGGRFGVIARSTSAADLADAIQALRNKKTYRRLIHEIAVSRSKRSMATYLSHLLQSIQTRFFAHLKKADSPCQSG